VAPFFRPVRRSSVVYSIGLAAQQTVTQRRVRMPHWHRKHWPAVWHWPRRCSWRLDGVLGIVPLVEISVSIVSFADRPGAAVR